MFQVQDKPDVCLPAYQGQNHLNLTKLRNFGSSNLIHKFKSVIHPHQLTAKRLRKQKHYASNQAPTWKHQKRTAGEKTEKTNHHMHVILHKIVIDQAQVDVQAPIKQNTPFLRAHVPYAPN